MLGFKRVLRRPIETAVVSGRSTSYQVNVRIRVQSGRSNCWKLREMKGR
jgi:hypothetical protein